MNEMLNTLLLLAVPVLPLLLAFPALRGHLPKAHFVALLPAVIAVATPATLSAELPWLLFSSELGMDGFSRLLLAMSVSVWAAALLRDCREQAIDKRSMTLYLLVMAGNFGAILAADLVMFFSFTTLMGYAFYGLLVATTDDAARPAARIYLWLMIVADLLLFEVLLLVAVSTGNLNFESAHDAMALSPLLNLTLWLMLSGFMLKAGIWPFHFWLSAAFRCTRPAVTLLLCVAPVSMALLGLLRWLPLGEISSPVNGLIVQGIGVSAMLYALVSTLKKTGMKMRLPVRSVIFMTGLFFIGIGAGLADAATWDRYELWAYYYVAALGFAVVLLVTLSARLQARHYDPKELTRQVGDSTLSLDHYVGMLVARVSKTGFYTLPGWRAWWLAIVNRLWSGICYWQNTLDNSERILQRWSLAITLFLLLGMVVVFFSGFSPHFSQE